VFPTPASLNSADLIRGLPPNPREAVAPIDLNRTLARLLLNRRYCLGLTIAIPLDAGFQFSIWFGRIAVAYWTAIA
jgi:hypothetical protein